MTLQKALALWIIRAVVLTAALAAFFASYKNLSPSCQNGLILGYGLALFSGLIGFFALIWAAPKSNQFYFGTFFAWLLFKLLVLGGAAFYVYQDARYDIVYTLVSLVGFTFIFTLSTVRLTHGLQRNS